MQTTEQRGFTLIELVVVIGIVAIIPTIIISNFSQVKTQFALSRTAHAFAQDVRRAQDLALSATPYKDSFGVPQLISGYGVYVDPPGSLGNKAYTVYADKQPGNQQHDAFDYTVSTNSFAVNEPGIIIKEIQNISGNSVSINFSPPKPNVALTPLAVGQGSVVVVFAVESDLSKTRTVTVNTSGLIEVK